MAYNFSPGPAVLPKAVLEKAQSELGNWQGSGMSVMEMSHRGSHFTEISAAAEANLRTLLNIPEDYKVLFFQGGASSQFSAIPLNLLRGKSIANYLETGSWSAKAIKEAKRYADVNIVASSKEGNYQTIPDLNEWQMDNSGAYFHYCPNETIQGVEFHWIPDVEQTLIADMSSTILSRPIDVSKFGMIYAGAQKNIGPAGLTLVIIKEELIGHAASNTPAMLDYKVQSDSGSKYNTPPTFAWYMAGLVFEWILEQGGLSAMANHNHTKAVKLYKAIDNSSFYSNPVDVNCRSWMNVPFILADKELDKVFLEKAEQEAGLLNLKGHRSVGGMRASIYNAMPQSGVDTLIDFMQDFEQKHG